MDEYLSKWVPLGVFAWSMVFTLVRNSFRYQSFDFCNRIVSVCHACLAVSLASLTVQDWSSPVCPQASLSTPLQKQTLSITVSYLIYDLICCMFDDHISLDNSVHHAVSIVGLGSGLAYGICGSEMVAALWLTEVSSPFLHMRELLKELGYKDTNINFCADVAFAVVFSLGRMVGGPYLLYVTVTVDNPLLIKAMALGLQLVSTFWFYKIARMIMYKFRKRRFCKVA